MKQLTLLPKLAFSSALTCLCAQILTTAQSPNPNEPYFQSITYGGNGAPQGSVGSSMSNDRKSFTLIFDRFVASVGRGIPIPESRKNADFVFSLGGTGGGDHISTFDFRGYVNLARGQFGTLSASLIDSEGSELSSTGTQFVGPVAKDYLTRFDTLLDPSYWPSGTMGAGPLTLRVNIRIVSPGGGALQQAVVLAQNSVWLRQNSEILSGNVIVNEASAGPVLNDGAELSIGQNVNTAAGTTLEANRIAIRQKANIHSDLVFNQLDASSLSTITGTQSSPLSLPVVSMPSFQTAPAGTLDVAPKQGSTVTLAPGDYRDVVIKQKSVLILDGGEYNLRNLDIGQNVAVVFNSPATVRVQDKLSIDQKSAVGPNPSSGLSAADLVIYVNGSNGNNGKPGAEASAARIGQNAVVLANIYAPNGTLWIREKAEATGAFIARDVMVGENAKLALQSAFRSTPSAQMTVDSIDGKLRSASEVEPPPAE